jgi:hypothetical protein
MITDSNRSHAKLSASGAHRWLNCTASSEAEAKMPDITSVYAQEGTEAHKVAERLLRNYLDNFNKSESIKLSYDEKEREVELYVDYVKSLYEAPFEFFSTLYIEKKVDFSRYVPEGFGTADAVLAKDNMLTIIDLKFGKGIKVSAVNNPQLRLYALGAYEELSLFNDFDTIKMAIVQPRLYDASFEVITVGELIEWGESIKNTALEAYNNEGIKKVGEWCRFCKAAPVCSELANASIEEAKRDFKLASDKMTMQEVKEAYDKIPMVKSWITALEDYVKSEAISGNIITGYKLVEGRSNRQWSNERDVIKTFKREGYKLSDYQKKMLKSVAEMEKTIGKTIFYEKFKDLVIKPPGSPTLVPEDDSRRGLSAGDDFI